MQLANHQVKMSWKRTMLMINEELLSRPTFEYKSVNPTFVTEQKKVSFIINGNLRGFQNHRKQAKIYIFHRFPSLGLNEPP